MCYRQTNYAHGDKSIMEIRAHGDKGNDKFVAIRTQHVSVYSLIDLYLVSTGSDRYIGREMVTETYTYRWIDFSKADSF